MAARLTAAGRGRRVAEESGPGAPAVVLVGPQLGENVGAAARAMLNFGLTELRLVAPRFPWPDRRAAAAASGAESVLAGARVFAAVEDALADAVHVLAATARLRDMVKPVLTPGEAAARLRGWQAQGERSAILFGREKSGLDNDDVVHAEALVVVPANPGYTSLNLAQAVLLTAYEWYQAGSAGPAAPARLVRKGAKPATGRELGDFFAHLESELDAAGFLYPPAKRPRMVRNIRNVFTRAGLTDQEVRTLRGIVAALTRKV